MAGQRSALVRALAWRGARASADRSTIRTGALVVGLVAVARWGAMGCQPAHQGMRTALAEARYADALVELRRMEPRLPRRSPRWQASYALERGLAHLAVGDAREAVRWLSRARDWDEARPGILTPTDHSRLVTAWQSMGFMPGERPID